MFSPVGWCTDMASSNFSGMSAVFGDEILGKMNGCEFHFHQSVQRQMKNLDEPHRGTFHSHVTALLRATTREAYQKAHNDCALFLSSNNETHDLLLCLEWWNERKHLMFKAFTSIDGPSSNLAEVVHAGWKNSKEINQSLLSSDLDVKSSLLLNQHLKDNQEGKYDGGRSPTQPLRQKRKLSKDIQTATQIGHDILDYDVDMTLTPTMVKSSNLVDVFHADGGCKPKKKSRPHKIKCFPIDWRVHEMENMS